MHYFSADKPIQNAKEDKLDRANYAEKIAESLKSWHGDESLVVCLSGTWGIGKTSLKNLIKENLENTEDNNTNPIIIEFNPWEWSSQHKIPKALLGEIEASLRHYFKIGWFKRIRLNLSYKLKGASSSKEAKQARLPSDISKYRLSVFSQKLNSAVIVLNEAFSELKTISLVLMTLSIAGIIWADSTLVKSLFVGLLFCSFLGKWGAELFSSVFPAPKEKSYEEQKSEIRRGLKTLTNNIIVFIDDLDRLNKEDLKEIFQLVKANCDFPNLVFFLLMDYERTASLLNSDGSYGLDYLEKIIQIPLEVPPVEEEKISQILDEEVNKLISKYSLDDKFDNERWVNLFHQGIKVYFKNLRDLYKYISTVNFYFTANSNKGLLEVNPVDLLTIEAIRVFEPEAYEAISRNKFLLTSDYVSQQKNEVSDELQVIVGKSKLEDKESFEYVLRHLFLKIDWAMGGMSYASDFYSEWQRDMRICSNEYFDHYFQFKIPKGSLSAFEKEDLLRSIDDEDSFLKVLEKAHEEGRLKTILKFLDDQKREIKTDKPRTLINALMRAGEKTERFGGSYSEFDNFTHCCRIIYWFLKENYSEGERYDLLSKCFQKNKSFAVMSTVLYYAEPKEGKDTIFNEIDLENLKAEWLKALRSGLKKNPLFILDNARLSMILNAWKEYGTFEELQKWFAGNVEDSTENLLKFIQGATYKSESNTVGSALVNIAYKVDRDFIERFTNFDAIYQRLSSLPKDKLNDNDRAIIDRINEAAKEQSKPSFFNEEINKETLRKYTQWLYRDLPAKENIEDLLLKDIDLRKYPKISNLDQVHTNAQEFLEWYKDKNPKVFESSVDYLTKALGYEDEEFLARHAFGQETREAIKEFKNLKDNLSGRKAV